MIHFFIIAFAILVVVIEIREIRLRNKMIDFRCAQMEDMRRYKEDIDTRWHPVSEITDLDKEERRLKRENKEEESDEGDDDVAVFL